MDRTVQNGASLLEWDVLRYGEEYRDWKGWTSDAKFAVLTSAQRDYFDSEMACANLTDLTISRVLEIGFGNGEFMRYGRERGWDIRGTEMNPHLVEAARRAGFEACSEAGVATMPDGLFDLIAAFDVLEHIPQADLPHFISMLAVKLKPNGALLCKFPNGDSPFGRPFQNGDITHVTILGEAKVVYLARVAGLRVARLAGEARSTRDRSWRMRVSRLVVRLLELTLEPCIKNVMFPGWKFALFSPNTVVVLRRQARS
jgi:2-polyprenyl-3-methyl-5-hydroxy-6-metoxy-1,4-benzoquinol methylase